ncbi:MAG: fluoride efflux transporter FluC [Microbacteriaceae bacterium]
MRSLLAVIAGAVVGTGLRLTIDIVIGAPVSTLVANIVGSFVLALLVAHIWPSASAPLKAALGPGLLGSFTTFSALAITLLSFAQSDQWVPALAYLAATIVGGLLAAFAGLRIGRRS